MRRLLELQWNTTALLFFRAGYISVVVFGLFLLSEVGFSPPAMVLVICCVPGLVMGYIVEEGPRSRGIASSESKLLDTLPLSTREIQLFHTWRSSLGIVLFAGLALVALPVVSLPIFAIGPRAEAPSDLRPLWTFLTVTFSLIAFDQVRVLVGRRTWSLDRIPTAAAWLVAGVGGSAFGLTAQYGLEELDVTLAKPTTAVVSSLGHPAVCLIPLAVVVVLGSINSWRRS